MRRATPIRLLLLASALSLSLVPAATASTGPAATAFGYPAGTPAKFREMIEKRVSPGHHKRVFRPSLTFHSHSGYLVGVIGFGNAVAVEVTRDHGRALTAYVARGTVTRGRLEASFGDLGRVAMRFRPAPNQRFAKHSSCHGQKRFRDRRGVYVGTLLFKGERDYLKVKVHRVKGKVRSIAPRCERRFPGRRPAMKAAHPTQHSPFGEEPDFLFAGWRHAVDSAELLEIGGRRHSHTLTIVEDSQGQMAIVRFAIGSSPADAFSINDELTHAQISPSAPFQGKGIYRAAPDGTTTWTGSLAVDFPGAPDYRLSGPPFEATLEPGY